MVRIAVIIPAFNPLPALIDYVKHIQKLDIEEVIVVNDGSDEKYNVIFDELKKFNSINIIEHEKNSGKGRALKTGFQYVMNHLKNIDTVITVGAHGQHKIRDVQLIIHNASVFSNGIILGVRNFHSEDLPLTSRIGNRAASILFSLLFHKRLLDTQTGLRCIPKNMLFWLLRVPRESFSYDTNMLVEAINRKLPIYEIPIGHMRIKKNSIIHYDEIINSQRLIQQMFTTYKKSRDHLK